MSMLLALLANHYSVADTNSFLEKMKKVPHRTIIAFNLFKGGWFRKNYIKKLKKQWNSAEMSTLTKSLIKESTVFIQTVYLCLNNILEIVMYTDENSDRESEYEERSPEDSPNITKKSVSTVGFRNNPENQNARPLALRSTQSFTGAIEELRFSNNFQRLNLCNRTNATPQKLTAGCPCGCHLRPAVVVPFRTRERNTLALHVVSPEVLHYHGYSFEPCQIAMFWKKDCRMFLWKKTKMEVVQIKT